ncbi:hypothetical protein EVA_10719 [gut metagenome]|uniref:Uncharacterized protein n=1 Tax=gut metagenome TaxID=749906 RepID=J9G2V4_9ZZZZ
MKYLDGLPNHSNIRQDLVHLRDSLIGDKVVGLLILKVRLEFPSCYFHPKPDGFELKLPCIQGGQH